MSITVIPQQIIVQVANPALQGPQGIQGPPGSVSLVGYTVATLPAGTKGMMAYVTDATAPTYLGTLTGGGTVVSPVFHNGIAWVSA